MTSNLNDNNYRELLKQSLRQTLDQSIDIRVNRYIEVKHQGVVPNHHFAGASTQSIDLYRDGYFLSAVMVSQSVAEGIWRFVLERNNLTADDDRPAMANILIERKIITEDCAEAFNRIWRSFRNDVHHMNPKVSTVPFDILAKRNLVDLGIIEREIFAFSLSSDNRIAPAQPKYWDVQQDGKAEIFLRGI
jgi:hypothetical protein